MTFRLIVAIYGLMAILLLSVSFITTRRAKQISGDDHYLFTQTRILYDKYVPPKNATDAALDDAQSEDDAGDGHEAQSDSEKSEASRAGVMAVDEPLFVLGFLDVSGSFIVLGGLSLLVAAGIRKSRQKRRNLALQSQ